MKTKIFLFVLLSSCSIAFAQDKYNVVLEQAKERSPYEAIYLLMEYQTKHPENANVYYQLGNRCYAQLPTRDPLHHYNELSALLYQSRLFYGNCLHFAKDQKLQGPLYEEIANGQKRIEYATLEQYIRPRLDEVKRQQTACDSIHRSFLRMTERYNRCQTLFSDFLQRYSREKTAHLQLQPAERQMLVLLRQNADSLQLDIEAFQQALALQPIPGYAPVFRTEPIVLYRLDGLTYTDFLQNDIATWDYGQWVTGFLDEQEQVYERLYADLNKEQQQLDEQLRHYDFGTAISGKVDASLIGRCARLELRSAQVDTIRAMQEAVLNRAAQQTIAQSAEPQTIREMIPLLQIAASRRKAATDEVLQKMTARLIEMAQPLQAQMQAVYTHPVSGEKITYEPLIGEQVYCLLPDETGYRCVITDDTRAACVLCLNEKMTVLRKPLRKADETPLLFTRIPGQLWVLITDKHIYWVE